MMKIRLVLLFVFVQLCFGQDMDSIMIRNFFSEALSNHSAYNHLKFLCKEYPGRLPASKNMSNAIYFLKDILEKMDLDSVYLQKVMVPDWRPGDKEYGAISSKKLGKKRLTICALGYSVGTTENGIQSQVIEVHTFDDLKSIGKEQIQGKIIFYNRPMDPTIINTMQAYVQAVDQRVDGAIEAAKYEAKGVIVRSVTTRLDNFPHTGVMRYKEGIKKIPAVAVSTNDAEVLSKWLKEDPELTCTININCALHPDVLSYNLIGEMKGSEFPDEIILVGGHLDSWFNTEGAHDNAAGCIHSIEVIRILKQLQVTPRRTIRCVLFNDEETMQTGGKKYAETVKSKNEKHILAIESDRGGDLPQGFTIDAPDDVFAELVQLKKYFIPYNIFKFIIGFGGTDIKPLKEFNVPLIGFLPDAQRYFDYHHSGNDTFEQVHFREFQMGSAAITSLVYLIDKYGF